MLFEIFAYLSVLTALFWVSAGDMIHSVWDIWKLLPLALVDFLGILLLFVLFLWVLSLFVDTDRPLKQPSRFFQRLTAETCVLILRLTRTNLHTAGIEQLPLKSHVLLVCNHRHYIDPVVILAALKTRAIGFVAKKEIKSTPLVGKFLYMCGGVFLDRENNRAGVKAIRAATEELAAEYCDIAIFPEGTRNTKDVLLPLHSGAFSIAKRSGTPVAVATLQGTERIFKNFPFYRTDVRFSIHTLIPAEDCAAAATAAISEEAARIMTRALDQQT